MKKKNNMSHVLRHAIHVIMEEMRKLIIVLLVILIVFLGLKQTEQLIV